MLDGDVLLVGDKLGNPRPLECVMQYERKAQKYDGVVDVLIDDDHRLVGIGGVQENPAAKDNGAAHSRQIVDEGEGNQHQQDLKHDGCHIGLVEG